jgi:hypothetical protein
MRLIPLDEAIKEIIAVIQDLDDADDIAGAYRDVIGGDALAVRIPGTGEFGLRVSDVSNANTEKSPEPRDDM